MEYKEYILKDIATIQTGPFGSQLHQKDYIEDGTPIITVEHLGENKILHNNLPGVKKEDVERLSKYSLIENDIVFSRVGSVDRRALVSKEEEGWLFSGRCLRVRVTSELVNPQYLSYYFGLSSSKEYIRNIAVGATMPSINTKILADIKVVLPDLERQNKVIEILHSIDSKIWINDKVISNFEKLSRILFKHWFIDFEFPNEQGQPYKLNGGEMIESEIGIIPEEWNIEDLDSITSKFATGLNPRKNFKLGEGSNYYVTIKNLGQNRIYLNEKCDKVTDEALVKINKRSNLKSGDLLFSGIGTIGRVFLIDKDPLNWNISESLFTLRPNEKASSEYLYLLLLSNDLQNYAKQLASGSVQKGIRMGDLKKYKVPLPPTKIMKSFTKLVSPQIELIKNLERESDKLSKLRDTLLPKLMTGEIEVPILEPEQV